MRALLVWLLLLAGGPAPALAMDVATEGYRKAGAAGAVGTIAGRALEDPKHPDEPSAPFADVGVTLVPRSEALLAELERIRSQARRESEALRSSASAVTRARRDYERALWQAGAADLVRFTSVEPDGAFLLEQVPAGDWLLLAQRAIFIPKPGAASSPRDRVMFTPRPHMTGYYLVTIWLRTLTVRPGGVESVELTDRGAWMMAIAEERAPTGSR